MFSNHFYNTLHLSKISFLALPLFIFLTACGGAADGDEPTDTTISNKAPTLSLISATELSINLGELASLSAAADDQEDGDISANIVWHSNIDGNLGYGANINASLTTGIHVISATISDSGNLSVSADLQAEVTEPEVNQLPVLMITSPTSNFSGTTNQAMTFAANASDEEDGDISLNIQWNSSIDGDLGSGPNISQLMTAGNHLITASVSDSGNLSTSNNLQVEVIQPEINQIPVVLITSPENNFSADDNQTITFTASATDDEDGDISANILWYSSIDGAIGTGGNISALLTQGNHLVSASVEDSNNQLTGASLSIEVAHIPPNQAPMLTLLFSTDNLLNNENEQTNFLATASDNEDGDISANIQWQSDLDGVLGMGDNINIQLSPGNHNITAYVIDAENSSANIIFSITINQLPLVYTGEDQSINESLIVSLTAEASDPDGEIDTISWLQVSGKNVVIDDPQASSITFTAPDIIYSEGPQAMVFEATVSDNLGATSSDQVIVTINPIRITTGIANLSWTAPSQNTDSSNLEDLSGFKIYYGESSDNLNQSITVEEATTVNWTIENLTAGTTYFFAVSAFNAFHVESDLSTVTSKFIAE